MSKAAELAKMGEVLTNSQIGGRRNIVINGAMQVSQRGTTITGIGATSGVYSLDRYRFNVNGSGRATVTQSSVTPSGFANSLKIDVTTAVSSLSAGNFFSVVQKFEGQDLQMLDKGTSDARTMTLSFYVKSNITGTYIIELFDFDNTRTISKSYTINSADTWEQKIILIDADTTGTLDDDNDASLQVTWWLAAGTTYSSGTLNTSWASNTNANRAVGQVNLLSSTDNEFLLTGVQLEVGSTATPFEHRSFVEELALCQRYFFQINGTGSEYATMGAGQMYTTTSFLGHFQTPVPMRTRPSFSLSDSFSNSNFSVVTGGHVRAISSLTPTGDNQHLRINATVSGATQGHGGYIQLQSGYNALWDAEL